MPGNKQQAGRRAVRGCRAAAGSDPPLSGSHTAGQGSREDRLPGPIESGAIRLNTGGYFKISSCMFTGYFTICSASTGEGQPAAVKAAACFTGMQGDRELVDTFIALKFDA